MAFHVRQSRRAVEGPPPARAVAFRIAAVYAVASLVWIFVSDSVVLSAYGLSPFLLQIQTLKGAFFIVATAGVAYAYLSHVLGLGDRSRESLAASELKYRSLVDAAQDTILLVDAGTGEILEANAAALRLLGRHPEHLCGCPFRDLLSPGTDDPFRLQPAGIRSGSGFHRELDFVTAAGETIPVEISASITEIAGHRVAVTICHDLRARKAADDALRQSEDRYRTLVETSPDGILLTDLDTRVVMANVQAARLLGFERAPELLGRSTEELVVPEDRPRIQATRRRILVERQAQEGEYTLLRPDGGRCPAECHCSAILDAEGQPRGFIGVVRDITHRKLLEEQLRQSQKMEAIGRLAGGIAHDFNNMVAVVTGYSELLKDRFSSDEFAREALQEIRGAADRTAALARQLLAFSRKQQLTPESLDVGELIGGLRKMLERLIGEDISLVTRIEPGIGRVMADAGQLEQVLLNLVVNARDAMPRGGALILEAQNIDLSEERARRYRVPSAGAYVALAVTDTGCGMDQDLLAHIFEPFFTTKEQGKGTGLGLATVYGIVRQSGGHITVHSEPEWGTTFRVYLPRVETTSPQAAHAAAPARVRGGAETILLVEDDPQVRNLIRDLLSRRGYQVIAAENGRRALELWEQQRGKIDLVLCDVVLPGPSGSELAAHFRSLDPAVRILFMSGHMDEAIGKHGVTGEGPLFVQKPFTPDELARKVRMALDSG